MYPLVSEQVGPSPESNSILKCILGPKRFWVHKIVGSKKLLVQKNFVSNKICGQKNFGCQKILGPQEMFHLKKMLGQKKFGPKNFWVQKFLGSMLPQYIMALCISFVSFVCQKKN